MTMDVSLCPPGSGVTVVVPTNGELSAIDISEATITLGGAYPSRCWLADADRDGDEDLLCKFARKDLDLTAGTSEVKLTFETGSRSFMFWTESATLFRCR
jgi:hypothetical protein